jgi:hypothetical protein
MKQFFFLILIFSIMQCRTTKRYDTPTLPSKISFTGYDHEGKTTYCFKLSPSQSCKFSSEQTKYAQACKAAQRCENQACAPAELEAVPCEDCMQYLCSEYPYQHDFSLPDDLRN